MASRKKESYEQFRPIGLEEWDALPLGLRDEMLAHWGATGEADRVRACWDRVPLARHEQYYQTKIIPNAPSVSALIASGNESLLPEALRRLREACEEEFQRQSAASPHATMSWDFGAEAVEAIAKGSLDAAKLLIGSSEELARKGKVRPEGGKGYHISAMQAALEAKRADLAKLCADKDRSGMPNMASELGKTARQGEGARAESAWEGAKTLWDAFPQERGDIRAPLLQEALFAKSEKIRSEALGLFEGEPIRLWVKGLREAQAANPLRGERNLATLLETAFELQDPRLARALLAATGIGKPSETLQHGSGGLPPGGSLAMRAILAGPEVFGELLEAAKREGSLEPVLGATAWIVEEGSLRKKGDAFAFCVAHGKREEAAAMIEASPGLSRKYAKDALAYLQKRHSKKAFEALSFWEALVMSEAKKIAEPAAAAPKRSRGL